MRRFGEPAADTGAVTAIGPGGWDAARRGWVGAAGTGAVTAITPGLGRGAVGLVDGDCGCGLEGGGCGHCGGDGD